MNRRLLALVMFGLLTAACTGGGPSGPVLITPLSPSNSPSTSPVPTLTEVPTPSDTGFLLTGLFPHPSFGSSVTFQVNNIDPGDRSCALHQFPAAGHGELEGAFESNCESLPRVYFFHVTIKNNAEDPLPLSLDQLFVVDRNGKSHQPLDLAGGNEDIPALLPDRTSVAPDAQIDGWVVFAATDDYTPDRFQFVSGGDVSTVRFAGQETILPGGTLAGD